jgi:hypothetical protein
VGTATPDAPRAREGGTANASSQTTARTDGQRPAWAAQSGSIGRFDGPAAPSPPDRLLLLDPDGLGGTGRDSFILI